MQTLFVQSLLNLPAKTAQWRQTMAFRFPDDDRNDVAAEELDQLAHADTDTVDQATWAALEAHAGTKQLRDAINETSREVGFKHSPRNLNDFFAVVQSKLNAAVNA